MYNIINHSLKRMIRILKKFTQSDTLYSINDLAEVLNISTKTLIKDFKELNKYFSDVDGLYLIYKNNNDKIDINLSIEDFTLIQSKILLDALIIKFIFELLEKPYKDINYYADKLYTSKSSIYRMIIEFNNHFRKYQIEISNEATLYYLNCKDEYNYRRFVTGFLLEVSGNDILKTISYESYSFFYDRLLNMHHNNAALISDYYVDYYSLFYFISLKREKEGYHIEYSPYFVGCDVEFLASELEQLEEMEMILDVKQLHSIESTIYISNYLLSSLVKKEDILVVNEFIDLVYQKFGLKIDYKEQNYLLNIFVNIFMSSKYNDIPYPFLNDRFVFFSENIKKSYAIVYNQLTELLSYFEKKNDTSLHRYENYLIYILIITNPEILNYNYFKPVLIVSSISKAHAEFILNYLKKELQVYSIFIDNATCVETRKVNNKVISEYSLIISDIEFYTENNIVVDKYPFFDDHIKKIKEHILDKY